MHAAAAAAVAAKSDILFRPRAKVMRERERERQREREREGGGGNGERRRPKIGVFCRDDLCVSFCERRREREGEGRERGRESWRLYLCGRLPPFLHSSFPTKAAIYDDHCQMDDIFVDLTDRKPAD